MKRGLTSRIFIIYNIFIVVIILVLCISLRRLVSNNYWNEQKHEYKKQGILIEESIHQYNSGKIELQKLKENINYAEILMSSIINIIDEKALLNKELSSSTVNYKFTKEQLKKLQTEGFIDIKIKTEEFRDLNIQAYAISMFEDGKFKGAIVFNDFPDNIKKRTDLAIDIFIGLGILTIIISNVLCYGFLKKHILKEIEEVKFGAKLIAIGHRERRIEVEESHVFREVAESINSIAADLQRIESSGKELVSNVSHELRAPITTIRGFVQAILDGIVPEEKVGHYLQIVQNEIERLSRLINNLLDLSAYETNNSFFKLENFDVNQLIQEVISIKEADIIAKNASIDLIFQDEIGNVLADRDKIFEVIFNILDNAIKYVCDYGMIQIETITLDDRLTVSIFNSGPCIKEENLMKIWNRFFKDEKIKSKTKSSGLGLAIVKNIIDLHDEKIWVENVTGTGVRFIFTLKRQ